MCDMSTIVNIRKIDEQRYYLQYRQKNPKIYLPNMKLESYGPRDIYHIPTNCEGNNKRPPHIQPKNV